MSNDNQKKPVIYVTRDIERAFGATPSEDYHIFTNLDLYSSQLQKQYPEFIHTISVQDKILDTRQLLQENSFIQLQSKLNANILVFKNNIQIEAIIREHGWKLLNPSAILAEKIENKISQIEWLGDCTKYLPETVVKKAIEIEWEEKPIIIQWAHGHTGESTILVKTKKELEQIQGKFPERIARVSDFISGPSFTVNIVVGKNKILAGNMSYQITGLVPFTDNQFTTIGNDWSVAPSLLTESEFLFIDKMIEDIGKKMQAEGWHGLFGLDIMKDDERDRILLIEINARQPASTTFESKLQIYNRELGLEGLTTFEAHLHAFLGIDLAHSVIPINDGAQIIQRVTKSMETFREANIASLRLAGFNIIHYANKEYNTDLVRIQSQRGIVEAHAKLNARGKEIREIILA